MLSLLSFMSTHRSVTLNPTQQNFFQNSFFVKCISKSPCSGSYLNSFPQSPFLSQPPILYEFPQQNKGYTEEPTAKQNPKHLITSEVRPIYIVIAVKEAEAESS